MSRDREFDVIVFGATGFTGHLVAEYLAGRYGVDRDVTWAMAGRNRTKLEAVRDEIGAPPNTPLVVADSADVASLTAMAERTRCVLTTVGPYLWYGEGLVQACAETGTDSVDLSGEVLWMRDMIERHHGRAVADGFEGPEQPGGNNVVEDDVLDGWSAPFFMAPINTRNIHRSNALMGHRYGEDFQYDEMFFAGPGDAGHQMAEAMAAIAGSLGGDDGPESGEGPSREQREAGGYELLVIGSHADGREIRARVTGDKDPGYGSTSKIIAEAALCLIDDCPDTPGGICTPAAALGDTLIPRLVDRAGKTFDLVDVGA